MASEGTCKGEKNAFMFYASALCGRGFHAVEEGKALEHTALQRYGSLPRSLKIV